MSDEFLESNIRDLKDLKGEDSDYLVSSGIASISCFRLLVDPRPSA
jgi:hypothetical protein